MSATTVSIQLGVDGKPTTKEEVKAWKCDLPGVVISTNQRIWDDKYVLTHVLSGYSLPQGAFKTIKAARRAAWRIGREITIDWELGGHSVVEQFNALTIADRKLYRDIMGGK